MTQLKVYTREPSEIYPDGLARSVHLSLLNAEGQEIPLNRNYGMLFATAVIDENNCISPRFLAEPHVTEENGGWVISARMEEMTDRWFTTDFRHFQPLGLSAEAPRGMDRVTIPDELARELVRYWNDTVGAPFSVDPAVPEGLTYPLLKGYGDPVLLKWEGKYFYIATNDKTNNVGLYIRTGDTMQGVFGAEEKLLLAYNEEAGLMQTFWAPEFHMIGGRLSILFAVSGKVWGPQCQIMQLKDGAKPDDPDGWTAPRPILRRDGTSLAVLPEITLDMTCIHGRTTYVVWSQRNHIGTPMDTGSMLYIAELNEKEPWKLASEPVLLSRPLFGWENVAGTINNEGPYALVQDGKVWLTYSGGSANGFTYVVGLLTADAGADLLKTENWVKNPMPVLSFASVPGEYGPGHNSFFRDDDGQLWIAYHTVMGYDMHERCVTMHKLGFVE